MRYVAELCIAFRSDGAENGTFELQAPIVILDAEGPRQALDKAISCSKTVFSNSENLKALGYPEKPVFYAVTRIHTDAQLPHKSDDPAIKEMYLTTQRIVRSRS